MIWTGLRIDLITHLYFSYNFKHGDKINLRCMQSTYKVPKDL